MTIYTELAGDLVDLLTEFGQVVTFKRTSGESLSPVSTSADTTGTTNSYTTKGIFKPFPARLVDGSRIQMADQMLVIDNTFAPVIDDLVTRDSEDWNIIGITTYKPASTVVAYSLHLRR